MPTPALTVLSLVFCLALALSSNAATGEDLKSLRKQFADPPNRYRILRIVHGLPRDAKEREQVIRDNLDNGFGGLVCNVAFDHYLESEENWVAFVDGADLAHRLGMTLWIYDEQGYPSGGAGGKTLQGHPEWQAHGLICVTHDSDGGEVALDLPEGELVSAVALPMAEGIMQLDRSQDLRDQVRDHHLAWKAPTGKWRVIAFISQPLFEGTHAAVCYAEHRPYINLLQTAPVQRFIKLTHQAYADRFPQLKQVFEGIFTDEPSLMSAFMQPQPYPALPWSQELPAQFRKRKGYDLVAHLPTLLDGAGPEGYKVRCDFWQVVGEIVADSFFGQIQRWSHAHGIASTGHLLWEEDLTNHVGYYGDFFRCARRLDIPGIDCLTSLPQEVPWHIAKLLGSIADLNRSPRRMSETSDFIQTQHPDHHVVTPAEVRGANNRLYVSGINVTTSYYSWKDFSKEQLRATNEYLGRTGLLLTGGRHICDIGVYYPTETVWTYLTPATNGATAATEPHQVNKAWRWVSGALFRGQRDFDYLDAQALRDAKVTQQGLAIADEHYRVIILPRTHTLPIEVMRKLRDFQRKGGTVIATHVLPKNSLSRFPNPEMQALSKEILTTAEAPHGAFLPEPTESALSAALDAVILPDFRAAGPLRYCHRSLAGVDWYFVINDGPDPWEGEVRVAAQGDCERWDPTTGTIERMPVNGAGKASRLHLRLDGYGGTFLSFRITGRSGKD